MLLTRATFTYYVRTYLSKTLCFAVLPILRLKHDWTALLHLEVFLYWVYRFPFSKYYLLVFLLLDSTWFFEADTESLMGLKNKKANSNNFILYPF